MILLQLLAALVIGGLTSWWLWSERRLRFWAVLMAVITLIILVWMLLADHSRVLQEVFVRQGLPKPSGTQPSGATLPAPDD